MAETGQVAETTPPEAPAPPPSCWETHFGAAPRGDGRSFPGGEAPCPGCDRLQAGPLAADLHPAAIERLLVMQERLPSSAREEPVLWVNSGKRAGPPAKSMHNQGLAVDVVVCGQTTADTAQALRDAGFTCVIEYYDEEGNPCNMAHGDLRGTSDAVGAYAPGGRKAGTCPGRAVSRDASCQNASKQDWNYQASGG